MDEDQFWNIIDNSRNVAALVNRDSGTDFIQVHEQSLDDLLRQLSPTQIVEFEVQFTKLFFKAYRWDLWAAAYWLFGGCSDDGFMDFRSCLISLGKDLYYQVLDDPDVLADIVDATNVPYMQAEGFQHVASRVYREITDEDLSDCEGVSDHPSKPEGESIDHDNVQLMRKRFPKLVNKYPDMG